MAKHRKKESLESAGLASGPIVHADVEEGRRVVNVRWQNENTTFEAGLARVGDIVKLVKFKSSNPNGLPVDQRKIPTEASVLGRVSEQGDDTRMYWLYLMEESLHFDGGLGEITEERVRKRLAEFQKSYFKKPHARRPELIDTAKELLQKGERPQDVANALVAQGVSSATAWRYIARAREA